MIGLARIGLSSVARRERPREEAADRGERRLRLVVGTLLFLWLLQASLGLAWDIAWHSFVGRDTFWTPPHVMIYSGVALSGLLCLGTALLETWRYRRGVPGVDDGSTVTVLGLFHAPLGIVVAGFGMLTLLIAAPLDNYWHGLYGIDVALWAPFHVMGVIGGLIGAIGGIYALAAEAARARRRETTPWLLGFTALELLALFALSGLLRLLLTAARPATNQFPTTDLGPLHILTYPALLAAALAFTFVAAVRLTGRPGGATAVALMAWGVILGVEAFVPWGIRAMAATYGFEYRIPGGPRFNPIQAFAPLLFLVPALAVDLALAWGRGRWSETRANLIAGGLAGVAAAPIALLFGRLALGALQLFRDVLPAAVLIPTQPTTVAVALGLLAAPFAALLAAWIGGGLGRLWHLNER